MEQDRQFMSLITNPLNRVRFALRSAWKFRRRGLVLPHEPKDALFRDVPEAERSAMEQRAKELRARYSLDALCNQSTRLDYRENLYVLDAFEKCFNGISIDKPRLSVVDVGSRNFNYAFAFDRFFRKALGKVHELDLCGIELDGYVIYRDFHSRADYAERYVEQTENPNARFIVGDFREFSGSADIVTLLFPFLTEYALLTWGLPRTHFAPNQVLQKAYATVNPGGYLVIFNQTAEEQDLVKSYLGSEHILRECPLKSFLVPYHDATEDRIATVIRKP